MLMGRRSPDMAKVLIIINFLSMHKPDFWICAYSTEKKENEYLFINEKSNSSKRIQKSGLHNCKTIL